MNLFSGLVDARSCHEGKYGKKLRIIFGTRTTSLVMVQLAMFIYADTK